VFQTKAEIALGLWSRSSVAFDWITANGEFGRDGAFLEVLEGARDSGPQRYLVEVAANTTVWVEELEHKTPDEMVWPVGELADRLPQSAWRVIRLREGAKGPVVFAFARVRVWGVRHRHAAPQLWLLIRQSLGGQAKGLPEKFRGLQLSGSFLMN